MEIRWAVRSTGCQQANWDAGGTALLGLRRGWGRPETQRAGGCVPLAVGRSLQSPSPGTPSLWSPLQLRGELVSHLRMAWKLFSLGCVCRSVWRNPPQLVLLLSLLGQSQSIAGFLLVELGVDVMLPLKTFWLSSLQMPVSHGQDKPPVHWHAQINPLSSLDAPKPREAFLPHTWALLRHTPCSCRASFSSSMSSTRKAKGEEVSWMRYRPAATWTSQGHQQQRWFGRDVRGSAHGNEHAGTSDPTTRQRRGCNMKIGGCPSTSCGVPPARAADAIPSSAGCY